MRKSLFPLSEDLEERYATDVATRHSCVLRSRIVLLSLHIPHGQLIPCSRLPRVALKIHRGYTNSPLFQTIRWGVSKARKKELGQSLSVCHWCLDLQRHAEWEMTSWTVSSDWLVIRGTVGSCSFLWMREKEVASRKVEIDRGRLCSRRNGDNDDTATTSALPLMPQESVVLHVQ